MSSNKLIEAAQDILSGSKKAAPAMPPEKLDAEVLDLGGPTPEHNSPTDDSNKLDTTKGATHAEPPTTKPSAASGKIVDSLKKEDITNDINAMFEHDTSLTEDFKQKASTIFEARVLDRVNQIKEDLDTQYGNMLGEAITEIQNELTEKVNDYLSYVVEQWMEENKIAIETGIRTELSEEFILGLKTLFKEHYIDIPENKVDVVEELSEKVLKLEESLNEEIQRGIQSKKNLIESKKELIVKNVCESLTSVQMAKIKELSESIEYTNEEEFKVKVSDIRENYFPSGIKKLNESSLHEQVDHQENKQINDPFVAAVSKAISNTIK